MGDETAAQAWIEAFVVTRREDDRADVLRWLSARGFDVMTTSTGLLARGPVRLFEEAFGLTLRDVPTTSTGSIPVPSELEADVTRVTILPVPEPH